MHSGGRTGRTGDGGCAIIGLLCAGDVGLDVDIGSFDGEGGLTGDVARRIGDPGRLAVRFDSGALGTGDSVAVWKMLRLEATDGDAYAGCNTAAGVGLAFPDRPKPPALIGSFLEANVLLARGGLLRLTAADLGKLNDGPPGLPSLATFEAVFATNTRRLGEAGDTVEGACEARGGLTRTVGDSV